MRLLGISGRDRDGAAAVSVDGEIVAAAAEESFARVPRIGYRHTGGYPLGAIDACLARAAMTLADIERVMVVNDGGPQPDLYPRDDRCALETELCAREVESVDPIRADARQTLTAGGDPGDPGDHDALLVVLAPERGASATFHSRGPELTSQLPLAGGDHLWCAITRMEKALGYERTVPYETLERLGSQGLPEHLAAFERALEWSPTRGIVVHDDRFVEALDPLDGVQTAAVGDSPANGRWQQDRQALAASFCARVNALVVEMAAGLSARAGLVRVGFGGGLFSSSGLAAALSKDLGDRAFLSPLPEPAGRAIGAALDGDHTRQRPLESLALGPEFSESDIKVALENCRLDYLYEPTWSRLIARISKMLSRGSVVAWFQGPMGFGPRSVGTRSILCDPSNRWARENINRFLRHMSIDDPLPVSMTASAMHDSLDSPGCSPFITMDALVKPEWRDRLRAALDRRQTIPVQMASARQSPALVELLDAHRERSGVPGLINMTLCGAGEPTACTPRDAVRTMFSSAIDALVIGRFLLMKDHWLLRSGADL